MAIDAHAMQDALLDWFGGAARDLPWRRTRDPYAILVSEVMLQQTQVARVLERYGPWLERWPTPAALAAGARGRRAARLVGPRLQPPRAQPPERGAARGRARRVPERRRRARTAAGSRALHRSRDRLLRFRRRGHGARHERAPRARALARHDRRGAAGRTRMGLEPGALRPRRAGLPGARAALRRAARWPQRCPSRGRTFAPLRRQSRFEGSRRQRRAALVRELADGPRADGGYDRDVVDSLLADGLAVRRADGLLALPEETPAP